MIEVEAKNNFATNRLEFFYDFMKDKRFTDVIFVVRNRRFVAHMMVLSACSDYFLKNESDLGTIFSDYEYPVIDAMLKYCYTGKISIDDKSFQQFLELAKKLQIKNIDPKYEKIDRTNCLEVLEFSDDPASRETAMSLTLENFETLYETQSFLNLPASILIEIITSNKLSTSVEKIFESIKFWLNSDEKSRRGDIVELFSSLKLTMLSNEFLIKKVMVFCSPYPECVLILQQTLQTTLSNCQAPIQTENYPKSEKIALVGDNDNIDESNTIDVYDGRSWTLSKNFRINRFRYASVLVEDWIMIIGGENSLYKKVSTVEYINLKNGQKHPLKPLKHRRDFFAAVTVSRDLTTDVYAIGGFGVGVVLSSVERWNSETKNWDSDVAPLLQPVYYHSASVVDGKIYVTGGRVIIDNKHKTINEVQVYSVESNSWSYSAPMIHKREYHSSVTINGKLFVGGGFSSDTDSCIDSVESYNVDANVWTFYCKLPNPAQRINLCWYRNKFLCIGGHDGKTRLSKVWKYDSKNNTWKALRSLNTTRDGSVALIIPHNSTI